MRPAVREPSCSAGLTTVAVKRGFSSFSARNLAPVRARSSSRSSEAGAGRSLCGDAVRPGASDEIKVEYKNTSAAHSCASSGRQSCSTPTIVSRADTWWEAWKQFYLSDFADWLAILDYGTFEVAEDGADRIDSRLRDRRGLSVAPRRWVSAAVLR
jgi:hypothetical protein